MVVSIKSISIEEAERGIYFDFEGFKNKSPAIAGFFYEEQFHQVILDPRLKSAADAKSLPQENLQEVIKKLLAEREANNRFIIAFSIHELKIIKDHCQIDVKEYYKNALGFVKRWKSTYYKSVELEKNSLDQFLTTIGYDVPKHLGKGSATKRLKAVIDMLETKGDYGKLTRVKKAQWTKLLDYNRHDVVGLRTLIMQAASQMKDRS